MLFWNHKTIHTTNIFKLQKVHKDIVKAIHTGGNDRIQNYVFSFTFGHHEKADIISRRNFYSDYIKMAKYVCETQAPTHAIYTYYKHRAYGVRLVRMFLRLQHS